jgi:hypothetical protein
MMPSPHEHEAKKAPDPNPPKRKVRNPLKALNRLKNQIGITREQNERKAEVKRG